MANQHISNRWKARSSVLVVALFLLLPQCAKAQTVTLTDSIRKGLELPHRFIVKLDSRNAFLDGISSRLRGIKVGRAHGDMLEYGFGISFLSDPPPRAYFEQVGAEENVKLRAYLLAVFAQYTFYQKRKWTASIPVQLGFGETWVHDEENDIKMTQNSHGLISYEAMMSPEYTVLRYFRVGLALGYRIGFIPGAKFRYNYSSPIYAFTLRLKLGDLRDDLFPKR